MNQPDQRWHHAGRCCPHPCHSCNDCPPDAPRDWVELWRHDSGAETAACPQHVPRRSTTQAEPEPSP